MSSAAFASKQRLDSWLEHVPDRRQLAIESPSRGGAVVVLQHSTEARSDQDPVGTSRMIVASLDQPVSDPLVVSLRVIMLNVFVDRVPKMLPAEEDHSIKTLGFDRLDETFGVGVQVRTLRGKFHTADAGRRESLRELGCVQRVTIVDEVTLSVEESGKTVCQISRDLDHPRSIGIWSNACDLDSASRKFHNEEHDIPNKPEWRPDLHGEEVARSKRIPVISDELVPCRLLRSFGRRLDPVALEDTSDRCLADVVTEVGQRSLDPLVAPGAVLGGHPNRKTPDAASYARPSGATTSAAVVLPGDELSVPTKNRVGRHDAATCRQQLAPKRLPEHSKPPSLVIIQTRPLLSEQLAQDSVLLLEILDNSGLLLVHPSRDRDEQDIPWVQMHGADCNPRHPAREGEP